VVLRLPEDLRRGSQRLIDVSLRRIRTILEDPIPSEECYKRLALKLLKRLPEDLLGQLPPKFWDIRARITVDDIDTTSVTPVIGDSSIRTITQRTYNPRRAPPVNDTGERWSRTLLSWASNSLQSMSNRVRGLSVGCSTILLSSLSVFTHINNSSD